jgi:hypothetical protein
LVRLTADISLYAKGAVPYGAAPYM